ncbi:MAG: hypothetical protein V7K89_08210 [Nostoc sp.]|uniref:hypothetical protein n=1 Tax=Nostoc sp. TaxID=1180 RepID=UPI002FFA6CCA
MAYSELQPLLDSEFKRLCGVSRNTFAEMVQVLHPHLNRQGRQGGQCSGRGTLKRKRICLRIFPSWLATHTTTN